MARAVCRVGNVHNLLWDWIIGRMMGHWSPYFEFCLPKTLRLDFAHTRSDRT